MSPFIILRDTIEEGLVTFDGLELNPIYDLNKLSITVQDLIKKILAEESLDSIESYYKLKGKIPLEEQICIFQISDEIDNLDINDFIYAQMNELERKQNKDKQDNEEYKLYLKLKAKFEKRLT